MTATTSVLVIDDEPESRLVLRMSIATAGPPLRWVGEAGDAFEGMSLWRMLQPDVVVLDQVMPEIDGLTVARAIRDRDPGQTIVLCSATVTPELERRARDIGVRACIPKDELHRLAEVLRDPPATT